MVQATYYELLVRANERQADLMREAGLSGLTRSSSRTPGRPALEAMRSLRAALADTRAKPDAAAEVPSCCAPCCGVACC